MARIGKQTAWSGPASPGLPAPTTNPAADLSGLNRTPTKGPLPLPVTKPANPYTLGPQTTQPGSGGIVGPVTATTPQQITPTGGQPLPTQPTVNGLPQSQSWQQTGAGGYQQPTLQQALAGLLGGQPMLQGYVDQATSGLKKAFDQEMANQVAELQSRYAAEGSYLSSPMFAAQGQLQANLTSQYLNQLGQLQLGAGEAERGRQQQSALGLAQIFGQLSSQAAQSGAGLQAAQLGAMADAYRTQAQYASNIYGTQAGYGSNIFGTQAGMFGNQLQYGLGQQQLGSNTMLDLLRLQQNQGNLNFNQQMQLAQLQQANQNQALQALLQSYYQPGQNILSVLQPFLGLPTVEKTTGGGIGDLLGGIAMSVAGGLSGNPALFGTGVAKTGQSAATL